jgi:hypothetical protein
MSSALASSAPQVNDIKLQNSHYCRKQIRIQYSYIYRQIYVRKYVLWQIVECLVTKYTLHEAQLSDTQMTQAQMILARQTSLSEDILLWS